MFKAFFLASVLCLLLFSITSTSAQKITIEGSFEFKKDSIQFPLSEIAVSLSDDDAVNSYTNKDGKFTLETPVNLQSPFFLLLEKIHPNENSYFQHEVFIQKKDFTTSQKGDGSVVISINPILLEL